MLFFPRILKMNNLIEFVKAEKAFRIIKNVNNFKDPKESCNQVGYDISRVDEDVFSSIKRILESNDIQEILFNRITDNDGCFSVYRQSKVRFTQEFLKTFCNQNVFAKYTLCERKANTISTKGFVTETTKTAIVNYESPSILTIVLICVGIAGLIVVILFFYRRRIQNSQNKQEVSLKY